MYLGTLNLFTYCLLVTPVPFVESFRKASMPSKRTEEGAWLNTTMLLFLSVYISLYMAFTATYHLLKKFCFILILELEDIIFGKMAKTGSLWICQECGYSNTRRINMFEHIEAKHVDSPGYYCPHCYKHCKTKYALNTHRSRYHKSEKM